MDHNVLVSDKRKKNRTGKNSKKSSRLILPVFATVVIVAIVAAASIFLLFSGDRSSSSTATTSFASTSTLSNSKLVILYVNQGNALVNRSGFPSLLTFVNSHGFNTIFFQVYRNGALLFNSGDLSYFVSSSHQKSVKIFFALYFTSPSQLIPASIYGLGEDGINLDMSALNPADQNNILSTLSQNYHDGRTAVTTTNFATNLKPDILVLETYDFSADSQYIKPGIVAGIEPLSMPSIQDYEQQFQYALSNSDGVMVFDYYGMLKTGF